ncbi:hypothetical protein G9A89_011503 [Geosiphon pyriformis]|nr:hypothetical protein G9A89_011503 [Geosiphon pyriformis]
MVLNHLVMDNELVLEPELVKLKVDKIIEKHVFDSAFSDVMCSIGFDKMSGVILSLPDEKMADFGLTDEYQVHDELD